MKKKATSHRAKLSVRQVRQVRRWAKTGLTQKQIALNMNVSQPTISYLLASKNYRNV